MKKHFILIVFVAFIAYQGTYGEDRNLRLSMSVGGGFNKVSYKRHIIDWSENYWYNSLIINSGIKLGYKLNENLTLFLGFNPDLYFYKTDNLEDSWTPCYKFGTIIDLPSANKNLYLNIDAGFLQSYSLESDLEWDRNIGFNSSVNLGYKLTSVMGFEIGLRYLYSKLTIENIEIIGQSSIDPNTGDPIYSPKFGEAFSRFSSMQIITRIVINFF